MNPLPQHIATAFYDAGWFKGILYLVIAVVVARVVDFLLERRDRAVAAVLKREPDPGEKTRFLMIRRLTTVLILFVGVAIALAQFPVVGTLARAMLASAAIIAGVVGIAARAPIANLASGIMIAFSQPVRLGDYVSVDEVYGTVEEIRLTYTFLRTVDDRRIVIPNEAFTSKVVHNYSMGSRGSMLEVTFVVPVTAPLDEVRRAAGAVADELAPSPDGFQNTVDVVELGASQITLRLNAWSDDPLRRRGLQSDLRAAVARRLNADGIYAGRGDGAG